MKSTIIVLTFIIMLAMLEIVSSRFILLRLKNNIATISRASSRNGNIDTSNLVIQSSND